MIREILLEKLQFASTVALSPEFIRRAELHQVTEYLTDNLVYHLTTHILADKLAPATKSFSYETPASWWQHTKAVAFPTFSRWMRRPPRTCRHTVTVEVRNWATFPENTIAYPKDLGPVRIHQMTYMAGDGSDPSWREES